MTTIHCSDPKHAEHEGIDGWQTELGETDTENPEELGFVCAACAKVQAARAWSVSVSASREFLVADGVDEVSVSYAWVNPFVAPPATVRVDVTGAASQELPVENGQASFTVAATKPGLLLVTVEGAVAPLELYAQEVSQA